MPSRNVILADINGNQIAPATTAEQVQYDEEMNVKQAIDNIDDSVMQIITPNTNYSMSIVKIKNHAFCIDCAGENDTQKISDTMSNFNIDKLTCLIITHFHTDHYGGIDEVLKHCDENTDIYIQMPVLQLNDGYSLYIDNYNDLISRTSLLGLKTPVVPTHSEFIEYDDVKLTFWNTDYSFRETYDNAWANNGNFLNQTSGINDYSLIVRFDYKDSSYVNCGDVEGEAQRLNAGFMTKATVVQNPHHWSNRMGYFDFYNALDPEMWIVTHSTQDNSQPTSPSVIYPSYLYRYLISVGGKCYDNSSKDNVVSLKRGIILQESGNAIKVKALSSNQSFESFLPPQYYNSNPYILRYMNIPDLVQLAMHCAEIRKYSLSGDSAFFQGSPIHNELNTLFSETYRENNNSYQIYSGYPYLRVEIRNATYPYEIVDIYSEYNSSNPNVGIRRYSLGWSRLSYDFETPISRGGSLPTGNTMVESMLKSDALIATLENNHMVRLNAMVSRNYIGGQKVFDGVATIPQAASTSIYMVRFTGKTLSYCKEVSLVDGTITDHQVSRVSVP